MLCELKSTKINLKSYVKIFLNFIRCMQIYMYSWKLSLKKYIIFIKIPLTVKMLPSVGFPKVEFLSTSTTICLILFPITTDQFSNEPFPSTYCEDDHRQSFLIYLWQNSKVTSEAGLVMVSRCTAFPANVRQSTFWLQLLDRFSSFLHSIIQFNPAFVAQHQVVFHLFKKNTKITLRKGIKTTFYRHVRKVGGGGQPQSVN